jgi:hypothetical protein
MAKDKNDNLSRYETDVEGVSLNKLEAGLWLARNRRKLNASLVIFLITISVITWAYGIYGLGYYILVGMNNDQRQMRELVETSAVDPEYLIRTAAQNLIVADKGSISGGGNYDFYAEVINPNAEHFGNFNYCFITSGGEENCGGDFILPGQKKVILALGKKISKPFSNLNFAVSGESWRRIDKHEIPDWKSFSGERLDISVGNAVFSPAAGADESGKSTLNNLSFTAKNNSAYGYWEAPFTIVLSRGNKPVYVNRYSANDFLSHETRELKISWAGAVGSVNSISIVPDINILDGSVYRQPE